MRIYGTIQNDQGQPIAGAQFQIVDLATGQTLTEWITSTNGTYYIDTPDVINDNDAARFKATGYSDFMYFIKDRVNTNGDVVMMKSNSVTTWLIIAAIILAVTKTQQIGNPLTAAAVVKNLKAPQFADKQTNKIFYAAIAGIILYMVYKWLVFLGVFRSGATIDLDNASTNPNSYWSPSFWRNKPTYEPWTYTLNEQQAYNLLQTIYDAIGWVNDNEDTVIGVFKSLRTQANLSYMAEVFYKYYDGQDLLTWLRGGNWPQDRLSDADVQTINQYISRLPKY